jgi:hypothetical protein
MEDENCTGGDVDSLLTRGFVGPTIFTNHWGYSGHYGRIVLIGHRGHRALIQEDPPLVFLAGVLPVWHCSLVYAAPTSPIYILTLNGGVGMTRVAPLWS